MKTKISIAVLFTIILGFSPRFFSGSPIAWDVYALGFQIEIAIWLLLWASYITYKDLFEKSVISVLFMLQVIDIITYPLWYFIGSPHLALSYFVKILLFCGWFLFIWHRNYHKESDDLDGEHFFKIGIIPNGFQDFILSLIKEPLGGTGIYVQGCFYVYQRGRLQIKGYSHLDRTRYKYRIVKMRPIDNQRLEILKNLPDSEKYSKWSWLLNCKTVLEPIISKKGKPIFWKKEPTDGKKNKRSSQGKRELRISLGETGLPLDNYRSNAVYWESLGRANERHRDNKKQL